MDTAHCLIYVDMNVSGECETLVFWWSVVITLANFIIIIIIVIISIIITYHLTIIYLKQPMFLDYRAYSVAATLGLHYMLHVMLFRNN